MGNHFSDSVDYLAFYLLFAYIRPLISNGEKPQKDVLGILISLHNFDQQNNVLIALEKYLLLDHLHFTCEMCKKWPEVVQYGSKLLVFQMPLKKKILLLSGMGNAYSKIGNRYMAQDYLEKSLNLSKQLGDNKLEMFLSLFLARFYLEIGEYSKSLGYFERQLEISKERHDINQEMAACSGLGLVYCKIDQNRKALDYFQRQLEISKENHNINEEMKACSALGNVYETINQNRKALGCFQRQLEISKEMNNIDQEMKACIALGNAHCKIGEYKKALDYMERSLEISKERHDIDREMNACNILGHLYREIGAYRKALGYFLRQLKISKEGNDIDQEMQVFSEVGNFYSEIGEYRKALGCFERQLEISKERHDIDQEMAACCSIGNIYHNMGEYEKARKTLESALDISKELHDTTQTVNNYLGLANVYDALGKDKLVLDCYEKALKNSRDVGNQRDEVRVCSRLGTFYQTKDIFEKSIEYFQQALKIDRELGNVMGESIACVGVGFGYFKLGQHDSGCKYVCQSISAADKIRESFKKQDHFNMSMCKETLSFYSHIVLMQCLLNLEHIKKALLVLDIGRSRSLYDLLRLSLIKINESPSQFIKWIDEIPSMISERQEDSHSDISANVCRSLQDGTILVYGFGLRGKTLFIWVVTREGTFYRPLSPNPKGENNSAKKFFERIVKEMRSKLVSSRAALNLEDERDVLIKRNAEILYGLPQQFASKVPQGKTTEEVPSQDPSGAAKQPPTTSQAIHHEAYQALIAPVEDLLRGSKLIVVPAHSLFLLPFSALVDDEGRYLCDRYSIQITPALHTLNFSLSVPMKDLGPALAVGNPAVGKVLFQKQIVDFQLPKLQIPNAGVEAAECAKCFDARPLTEKQATKKKVVERLRSASVVHIAAHGMMNYGEIFLAPDPTAPTPPEEEHYLLMPADILKCSLSARLIVLSCCHSGRGEISSEGVAGTARAFLGAGARAVLVSLWKLPDEKTRVFMKLFYENVCKGLSVCVALQQAMITFKEQDDEMEAWAPFEIFGEDVTLTSGDIAEIRRLSRECTE